MRRPGRSILSSALVALFLSLLAAVSLRADDIFAREPLTIERAHAEPIQFNVELALTAAQREQGLMRRRMMGEKEGMLFDFGETRLVSMWMKNTILPLDMLFMNEKGVITHIHENAVPFSEDIITSVDPIRYVLELNAGTVDKFEIHEGDVLRSAQIGNGK